MTEPRGMRPIPIIPQFIKGAYDSINMVYIINEYYQGIKEYVEEARSIFIKVYYQQYAKSTVVAFRESE